MKKQILFSLCCLLILFGCTEKEPEKRELAISAAASLTDAMDEVEATYKTSHPDITLTFNFAGSGTLARQIENGAPVDVFISANEHWMQEMVDKDVVNEKEVREVTGNKLVVIAQADSDIELPSIHRLREAGLKQIAIGNPDSVPAGEYTEAALKKTHQWDDLKDVFVYAKDVRQVLTYVETGNTDIGFVYESDALSSDHVKIITTAEKGMHDPIVYPGAVINDTSHLQAAEDFLEFLQSSEGQTILRKYGFTHNGE